MTNGTTVVPPRLDIKSWWTAFTTGALLGGFLAAAVALVTVMGMSPG